MGVTPGHPMSEHIGLVRDFRRKFKEYTKEEFRDLSNKPMIKDILKGGVTKLNEQQIIERVKETLEGLKRD